MDFSGVILAFGLSVLGLAVVAWLGGHIVLRQKMKFGEAATAGLLMVVLGGIGAVMSGVVYQLWGPGPAKPESAWAMQMDLFGFAIDARTMAVWMGGLALGYFLALEVSANGRWNRRIALSLIAAMATPALLLGSELAVKRGEQALKTAGAGASEQRSAVQE
jgi:hypothetical protein